MGDVHLTMSDQRTVLLTGGTGFLGSAILSSLVDKNRKIILLKRSTSDTARVRHLSKNIIVYDIDKDPLDRPFSDHSIDVIIHCAADQGRGQASPRSLLEANVLFPLVLLQMALDYHASCFINTDTALDKQVSAYALSKHQFREWLRTFSNRLVCINASLELFYGPDDHPSKFVTYVVRELLKNAVKIDFTRGEQKRDFIYIDDVRNALLKILDNSASLPKGYYNYEIGTGDAVPIRDIVTIMRELTYNTKTLLNFGALPYRDHEVMESRVDTSAIHKLGWRPVYSLRDGLRATIESERERLRAGK